MSIREAGVRRTRTLLEGEIRLLIISRRIREKIVINDNIIITLNDIKLRDNKIVLGIEAPQNVSIKRKEVYDAMRKGKSDENKS